MVEPDQQPGETDLWYQRFIRFYLRGGSERRLDDAFRRSLVADGADPAAVARRRAPGSWRTAANRWRWNERCRPHDEERRRELMEACRAKQDAQLEAMKKRLGLSGASRPAPPPRMSKATREFLRLARMLAPRGSAP
jgi:hypothetical protein